MGMDTNFTLIRHGQTEANLAGVLQGHLDTSLDDIGRRQAQCTAERLKEKHFDILFSSDLKRAAETAQILAIKLKIEVVYTKALREWNLGELEGRKSSELSKEYPEIMNVFQFESGDIPTPGGESWGQVLRRVNDFLEYAATLYNRKNILLVTHGGIMRAIYHKIAGPIPSGLLLPMTSNASYSSFAKRGKYWQLCCWNDISHLQNVGCRDSITF